MFESQEAVKLLRGWNPKTVCVVSNKEDPGTDCSSFVDACDVVIRVNRMGSYDTGKTGKKMDLLVQDCSATFFTYSREERNQHLWGDARFVMFTTQHKDASRHCIRREQIDNCAFVPDELAAVCVAHTTVGWAVRLADNLWPEAGLYFVGDTSVAVRASISGGLTWPGWHESGTEQSYFDKMVAMGRLVPLPDGRGRKSKPRGKLADLPDKDFLVKKVGRGRLDYEYARLAVHEEDKSIRTLGIKCGGGTENLLVARYAAMNKETNEVGALLYNAPRQIIVDWDSSGRKCYAMGDQAAVWVQDELPMWAGWQPI